MVFLKFRRSLTAQRPVNWRITYKTAPKIPLKSAFGLAWLASMGPAASEPKLLDRMLNEIRPRQFSIATERIYLHWARRYILFHGKHHPITMGKQEVEKFLTHLAVRRQVSASTQNVALAAILFPYQRVMDVELDWLTDVVRAKPKCRMPVVLCTSEVEYLLQSCRGTQLLPVSLLVMRGAMGARSPFDRLQVNYDKH